MRSEQEWKAQEQKRIDKRDANRIRRGNPQRFILRGPIFHGNGSDRAMSLESIDPPLEVDEMIEVVRVPLVAKKLKEESGE